VTVESGSWSLTRDYPHPPDRVFAAWADPAVKVLWFDLTDTAAARASTYRSDFRVGGRETISSPPGLPPVWIYEAEYRDIVRDERIVVTYEISVEGRRVSVSVATVTFEATPIGTRLTYVEQGAYLDGLDSPDNRRGGTTSQLERLAMVLRVGTVPHEND
jgi:uncharacterized protein YndB with AHSA1/START domain